MGLLDMVIQLCCTTSYSPLYIKGVVKYTLYKRIQDLGRDNRYFRCQIDGMMMIFVVRLILILGDSVFSKSRVPTQTVGNAGCIYILYREGGADENFRE
jgi:hypothetical protein